MAARLCRDSVWVHTCEESGATDGLAAELLPLKLQPEDCWTSPPPLFHFPCLYWFLICPSTFEPPGGTGTKATAPLLSVGLGVLLFLFIKGDFARHCPTKGAPQPQKICAFTLESHRSPRKTLMDEEKKEKKVSQ